MPNARYIVVRHETAWTIKFDDEEFGPYRSQSEAVAFAIDAAEKHNRHGESAEIVFASGAGDLPTRMALKPGHQPKVFVNMEA